MQLLVLNTVDIINIWTDIRKLNESSWIRSSDTLSNVIQGHSFVVYDSNLVYISANSAVNIVQSINGPKIYAFGMF